MIDARALTAAGLELFGRAVTALPPMLARPADPIAEPLIRYDTSVNVTPGALLDADQPPSPIRRDSTAAAVDRLLAL